MTERPGRTGQPYAIMAALVESGLRAQLKTGNLLTGELLVDLDFHPEAPPAKLDDERQLPGDPFRPDPARGADGVGHRRCSTSSRRCRLPDLVADLRRTVQGVEALTTSPDTKQAIAALTASANSLQSLAGKLDKRLDPLLGQAQSTLASTDALIGQNSQLRYDIADLLRELTSAARSIRLFADYLERHPEALIRGKTGLQ